MFGKMGRGLRLTPTIRHLGLSKAIGLLYLYIVGLMLTLAKIMSFFRKNHNFARFRLNMKKCTKNFNK